MNEIREMGDTRIKNGLGWVVQGSSGSGKSFFIRDLIHHENDIFKEPHSKIIYVYFLDQPHFEELRKKGVLFFNGWEERLTDHEFLADSMLILDDTADQISPLFLRDLYLKYSHHCRCTVISLCHHFFTKTIPYLREILLNTQVTVLLSSPRSIDSVSYWARQVFLKHYVSPLTF